MEHARDDTLHHLQYVAYMEEHRSMTAKENESSRTLHQRADPHLGTARYVEYFQWFIELPWAFSLLKLAWTSRKNIDDNI
jgi:hypothetical protein